MSEPSPGEVSYALSKFGEDARRWDDNNTAMDQAKQAASAIAIDPLAFGPAAWMGLADKYREVQQMIVDRCTEGAAEFSAIANNLIKARDELKRTEEENINAVNRVR
jgi:hypothetical protein